MNTAEVLKKTFLFRDFSAADLKKLASAAKEDNLGPETPIFREGEAGDALYIIVLGSVRVMKKNKDGSSEEVATLGTGSYFGEMAIVTDDHERTATILSKEPTTLVMLKRADIEGLAAKDDKFAHTFYKAVARGLAKRLAATSTEAAFLKALAKNRHL